MNCAICGKEGENLAHKAVGGNIKVVVRVHQNCALLHWTLPLAWFVGGFGLAIYLGATNRNLAALGALFSALGAGSYGMYRLRKV